jgi:hypothetical protein
LAKGKAKFFFEQDKAEKPAEKDAPAPSRLVWAKAD